MIYFGTTIGGVTNNYSLLSNSLLSTDIGTGPKENSTITTGEKCSTFKPFGTWNITP